MNILLSIILALFLISPSEANKPFDYKIQEDAWWQRVLKPEVYQICRKAGTEEAFSGQYDKFYKDGTYYCACCGGDHPLYSSKAKFDSGTGWPSFTEPISPQSIEFVAEKSIFKKLVGATTEVRCARCGSHLGHVFDDGPPPTHKRYCMNSLALTFTPAGQKTIRTYEINKDAS